MSYSAGHTIVYVYVYIILRIRSTQFCMAYRVCYVLCVCVHSCGS